MDGDLDAILRTIKEVEVSLERRYARAEGTLLMIWGLVGASIFAFYQLVVWNPDAYRDALGGWLNWVWLLPMALGYVASALVGARLGRMADAPDRAARLRRMAVPGLVVALLVTALVATGRYQFVYGGVTLVGAAAILAHAWEARGSPTRATSLAIGGAMALVGVALLALARHPYAPGIASAAFLVGYLTLGTVRYRSGA
ncbi:MAG TPA: hypothetical protein VFH78_15760 [Candidatus Thermoplasmatota archaeon]|nr:hypothetical protein [Candidatus Thermoplasmatota archaeon]